MSYLFGDATPFPLDENFIETLRSLIDASVELFRVNDDFVKREFQVRDARHLAKTEIGSIDKLSDTIQASLRPFTVSTSPVEAQLAASSIGEMAQTTLSEAMNKITTARDETIRAALNISKVEEVRSAVSLFFVRHQLPDTVWGAQWRISANNPASGVVSGVTKGGLHLLFDLEIPEHSAWSRALAVSQFEPELAITISKAPGLFGKLPRLRKEALHKLQITEIQYSQDHKWLVVRPSAKKRCNGLRLVIKDHDEMRPFVIPVNENDIATGPKEQMLDENAIHIRTLWNHIEQRIDRLTKMRRRLCSLRYGDNGDRECDKPQELAKIMLSAVAPIVREMRRRSRISGEIALKRQLSNGKREELFVPRDELFAKFAKLPDSQRELFDAMGLSEESTQEFASNWISESTVEVDLDLPSSNPLLAHPPTTQSLS